MSQQSPISSGKSKNKDMQSDSYIQHEVLFNINF